MNRLHSFRLSVWTGYLGLWILLPLWYAWLAPSAHFGIGMPLFFLLVPLLFPLPGMLRDRSYTFAWSSFLSLLYFIHGIGEFYSEPQERIYAGLEILFSLLWFGGAIFYVRKYKQMHANAHGSTGHREPGK